MIKRLVLCAALSFVSPAVAQEASGLACVTVEQADEFEAKAAAANKVSVLRLDGDEVKAFKKETGFPLDDGVDIITLFIFRDGHSEFALGSTKEDVKCVADKWVFDADNTRQLLKAVYGSAV
jgi:hypothetical protein